MGQDVEYNKIDAAVTECLGPVPQEGGTLSVWALCLRKGERCLFGPCASGRGNAVCLGPVPQEGGTLSVWALCLRKGERCLFGPCASGRGNAVCPCRWADQLRCVPHWLGQDLLPGASGPHTVQGGALLRRQDLTGEPARWRGGGACSLEGVSLLVGGGEPARWRGVSLLVGGGEPARWRAVSLLVGGG